MSLAAYVARRLLLMVPVVLGVTILVFFLIHLVPGRSCANDARNACDTGQGPLLHEQWGLDEPLPVQYERFMERLVRGDLGNSLFYSVSAGRLVLERLPVTLWLIGLGSPVLSADRRPASGARGRASRPSNRPRDPRRSPGRARFSRLLDRDHAAARVRGQFRESLPGRRLRRGVRSATSIP